jgi:hypothetical protein
VDTLTFFFDRTFGTRLPQALHSMQPPGTHIRWHQQEGFAFDMPDDEMFGIVGPRNWVMISQDRKRHLLANETLAVKQHNARCFYLPSVQRWTTLCHLVSRFEKMRSLAKETKPPFIFEMKTNRQFYKVKLP